MIDKAYEQLKTPKALSEIHTRFNEIGIQWNQSQVKLFLEMDKKIIQKEELFSTGEGELEHKVIKAIDQLFKHKPKIPLNKIMGQLPFTIGKSELLHIIEKSQSYYSPNEVIVCKK